MKQTPQLHASGFYEFEKPWKVKEGMVYECIAIRTFTDIYKLGISVYSAYYEPAGLVVNTLIPDGTSIFNFEEESAKQPNIITLRGVDGSVIYVPDTYITKMPDNTLVPYSQVVLGVSLGPLPDEVNIDTLVTDVNALVASRAGINSTVHVCRAALEKNPTFEEHVQLEFTRLEGMPEVVPNTQAELDRALGELEECQVRIDVLTAALIENGLTEST